MKIRELVMVTGALAMLAGCATAGGGGGVGRAQDSVRRQLQNATAIARGRGYTVAASTPATGALNDGGSEYVGVTLNAGREYLMVGVCDGDCSDMDLRLFSPAGNEIARDVAVDDTPVLQFVAPSSGSYRVRVEMADCNVNPCYYGVALYAR